MKTIRDGYLVIEALVYAGLLMVAALLMTHVLVHMVAFDRQIMQQVTARCQVYNTLAVLRKDLSQAPSKRTDYAVLAPTEITYTSADSALSWRVDQQRLLRIHEHKQGTHTVHDHAVVLESVTACSFTPQVVNNQVIALHIKLSHNARNFSTTIYVRNCT